MTAYTAMFIFVIFLLIIILFLFMCIADMSGKMSAQECKIRLLENNRKGLIRDIEYYKREKEKLEDQLERIFNMIDGS